MRVTWALASKRLTLPGASSISCVARLAPAGNPSLVIPKLIIAVSPVRLRIVILPMAAQVARALLETGATKFEPPAPTRRDNAAIEVDQHGS